MKSSTRLVLTCLLTFLLLAFIPLSCRVVMGQTYRQMMTKSGTSYTFTNADSGRQFTFTSDSSVAVTLPQANSSTFRAGWYVDVYVSGNGTVTITPTTSTIGGASSLALTKGQSVTITSNGTNYLVNRTDLTDAQRTSLAGLASVSSTELGHLDGVTSAIQTQLDNKQPLDSDLTAFAAKTAPSGAVVGTTDGQTLTTKTIDGDDNTVQDLPYSAIKSTSRSGSGTKVGTVLEGAYGASDQSLPAVSAKTWLLNTDSNHLFYGRADGAAWDQQFLAGSSGVIAGDYGGTGNGFMDFTGPATSKKTFTLPNASAVIITNQSAEINALTAKSSPTTSDLLMIEDAAASNAKKKSTVDQVLAANDARTKIQTNTTYSAEGTGNVLTTVEKIWLGAAGCVNTTAASFWDLPTSTPAVAACVTGTNTQKATLQFADTSGGFSAQTNFLLPADFTGNIDIRIIWSTSATSGNVKWSVASISTAIDASETDDPAFNSYSTVTTAVPGTANRLQTSSITSLTITGVAASELLHLKIFRDGNDGSDTAGATVNLIGVEVTLRRAQ